MSLTTVKYHHQHHLPLVSLSLEFETPVKMFSNAKSFIPYSPNVWILVGAFFFNGICMGIVETCCNSFLIQMWGSEKCASWLQALFFSFGLGCLVAPLLVRPFLLPVTEEDMIFLTGE